MVVINRYTPRIHELGLGNEFLSLHFLQCTNLALPNLRRFRWEYPRQTVFPFDSIALLWPLLIPGLDTLEVALSGTEDPKFQSFLDNYPPLCPNLKSIKLDFLRRCQVPATTSQALSQSYL